MAFPPKTQREQVMVLITIIAVGLAAAFWNFVFTPKRTEIAALSGRVDTLETRNASARRESAKGNAAKIKAEADQYARDLEIMRTLVPTGNEVPALLEQVSTAARQVGLDLSSVEPAPVVEGQHFDTFRYKIAVTGGYHALGEFLSNVGSLTRIMAPVNLTLTVSTSTTSAASQRRPEGTSAIDSKFEIQTYVAKTSTTARGGKL